MLSVAWHTRSRLAVGIATMLHKIGTAHQTATNCSRKFESIELSENPVSSSWLDAALYDVISHDTSGSSAALEVEQLMISLGAYRTAVQTAVQCSHD